MHFKENWGTSKVRQAGTQVRHAWVQVHPGVGSKLCNSNIFFLSFLIISSASGIDTVLIPPFKPTHLIRPGGWYLAADCTSDAIPESGFERDGNLGESPKALFGRG